MNRHLIAAVFVLITTGCARRIPLEVAPPSVQRAPATLPIRVGFLPPQDVRPEAERDGDRPSPQLIMLASGAYLTSSEGAVVQGDGRLGLQGSAIHFPEHTVPSQLGSHALDVTARAGIFAEVLPVPIESWEPADLPRIARDHQLDYVMTMEVRHFYVTDFRKVVASGSRSQYGNVVVQRHSRSAEVTGVAESAVFRFALHRVGPSGATTLWQRSTSATVVHPPSDEGPFSGAAAAGECLQELGRALHRLAGTRPGRDGSLAWREPMGG